jgi:hypothetical protein
MTGYYSVRVWLRELAVDPGRVVQIKLTDRNDRITAIEEERILGTGR